MVGTKRLIQVIIINKHCRIFGKIIIILASENKTVSVELILLLLWFESLMSPENLMC